VQLAMNCTINRVTKFSPLELLIGLSFGLLPLNEDSNDEVDKENLRKEAKKKMKLKQSTTKIGLIKIKLK